MTRMCVDMSVCREGDGGGAVDVRPRWEARRRPTGCCSTPTGCQLLRSKR